MKIAAVRTHVLDHALRIGAAFENQDGSWNVYMDALPTNGQLQIRDYKPFDRSAPELELPIEKAIAV